MILTAVLCSILVPNQIGGKITCYIMQCAMLFPFWKGHFFVAQIALVRKILVYATTNQNGLQKEKQYTIIVFFLTILCVVYFITIQTIMGPNGIFYQVSNSKSTLVFQLPHLPVFFLHVPVCSFMHWHHKTSK